MDFQAFVFWFCFSPVPLEVERVCLNDMHKVGLHRKYVIEIYFACSLSLSTFYALSSLIQFVVIFSSLMELFKGRHNGNSGTARLFLVSHVSHTKTAEAFKYRASIKHENKAGLVPYTAK